MAKSDSSFSFIESGWASSRLYAFAVIFLFAAFAFQLWFHAARTSATIDEGAHILAGHRHWQCGDFGINPEHPPLLKLIAALPLQFRTLNEPEWKCGSRLTPKTEMFSAGTSFLVRNSIDGVVIPTRLAAASLSLFLAVLLFLAADHHFEKVYGPELDGRREDKVEIGGLPFGE